MREDTSPPVGSCAATLGLHAMRIRGPVWNESYRDYDPWEPQRHQPCKSGSPHLASETAYRIEISGSATSMLVICQEETRGLRARSGERALRGSGSSAAHQCLTAGGPCISAGPDIHLLPRAQKPLQMIEFGFSASLETIQREPPENYSFAQSPMSETSHPALR